MNEFLLKLAPADLSVLDKALQEMPYKLAAPLVAKINAQIREQQHPPEGPPDEPGR